MQSLPRRIQRKTCKLIFAVEKYSGSLKKGCLKFFVEKSFYYMVYIFTYDKYTAIWFDCISFCCAIDVLAKQTYPIQKRKSFILLI